MFKVCELVRATGGELLQGDWHKSLKGICLDSRKLKPREVFLAIKGGNFDGHDFINEAIKKNAGCVIFKKGVKACAGHIALIKVADTTRALADIARFKRDKFDLPLVAVTGSNGKTTTKDMIAWVLAGDSRVLKNKGTRNNHIGLPQTLIEVGRNDKYIVLEIGTNHFGEVRYLANICRPNLAVITNIGQAHIEFLKNLQGVFKEKSTLLENLSNPRIALLNADDPYLRKLIDHQGPGINVFSFALEHQADFMATEIKAKGRRVSFKVNRRHNFVINTFGRYNIYNALAAIAAGRIFGLSYACLSRRLRVFSFPEGRLKLVKFNGLNLVDDTYNSNPLSLRRALEALADFKTKGRRILVMGDMLELGAKKELLHKEISGSITNICDLFVGVGKLARYTAGALKAGGFERKNIFNCSTSQEARELVFNKIKPRPDDIILIKGSRSMRMEEVFKV